MNREIKFRGLHNGNWVYGYLHTSDGATLIQVGKNISKEVNPNTIGQFTGLLDKNGKEIYEGDIISNYQANVNCVFWFIDGSWCIENYHAGALLLSEYAVESEIIGNIYENQELLKEKPL